MSLPVCCRFEPSLFVKHCWGSMTPPAGLIGPASLYDSIIKQHSTADFLICPPQMQLELRRRCRMAPGPQLINAWSYFMRTPVSKCGKGGGGGGGGGEEVAETSSCRFSCSSTSHFHTGSVSGSICGAAPA